MHHVIAVSLDENQKVIAEPNPLPQVNQGDTVVWLFEAGLDGSDLRVEFQEVHALPPDGTKVEPEEGRALDDPNGPCAGFSRQTAIVATVVAHGRNRFIYKFMRGDAQVEWGNKLDNEKNFGGLDLPQPPPR